MEVKPNTTNVVYIDEYPELAKRVWMRRLAAERLGGVIQLPQVIPFQKGPEDAA